MRLAFITLLLVFAPTLFFAQKQDSLAIKYASYISVESLKSNLLILASDEYEGRETGRKGQKMAAEYIGVKLKNFGAKEFYQHYLLKEKKAAVAKLYVNGNEKKLYSDYYFFPSDMNTKKQKSKNMLFLGYGIEDSVYNDYKDISVKNKSILIFSGEPLNADSTSLISGQKNNFYWGDRIKIKKAEEKGVKTIFIVKPNITNEVNKNQHRIESPSMILKNDRKTTTTIFISPQVADDILSNNGKVEDLKKQISTSSKPTSKDINTEIKIITQTQSKQVSSENVIGFIEGNELKNEVIVISAHYDHLGIKDGIVYNGADDDGSGTAALLELAKAFSEAKKQGHGPKRSILILAFSGEEKGLLGSSYYVENPYIPLSQTVCDLNIDMIGRVDEKHKNNSNYIYLIGSDKLSLQLHQISETANATYTRFELDYTYNDEKDKNRFYYRSDHYNFAKKGVPVIFYFNGVHEDYHQPTDDVEKIDFELLKKRCSLVFFTAWELANRNDRIVVDKK